VPWTLADIPDQRGRTIVVTGANAGIGLEVATALAAAGATVVLACRNLDKAAAARETIESRRPAGTVEVLRVDLADQQQIATAADEAAERFPQIHGLLNNAGVMGVPHGLTVDGFETVFGTNHLGHFAFTNRVLPTLLATPGSRVVTVSSMSHRVGRIRWDDLDGRRRYGKNRAYAQSKLANLLFAFELQRRLARAGAGTISLAAHPGFASTDLVEDFMVGAPKLKPHVKAAADRVIPADQAAMSPLRALTSPDAYGGQFYGPSGVGGAVGPPIVTSPARRSLDEAAQARLWDVSVELTGVDLPELSDQARRRAQITAS
jgi:NAD(P)-dependent dehydrogenase (short-subunit alcohol dehydrogenase family)